MENIDVPYISVFETTNIIMAATVQGDLKRAGFTALLTEISDGDYHVVVASEDYVNAKALLITKRTYGENFAPPQEE